MNPLDNSPCTRVPLTYLESLLSMWCDPCPPWSQVACKLTSPSPFPLPPPTVPLSNYAPFYDDITTPTSLSLAQVHPITLYERITNWEINQNSVTSHVTNSFLPVTIFIIAYMSSLSSTFHVSNDHVSFFTVLWSFLYLSAFPLRLFFFLWPLCDLSPPVFFWSCWMKRKLIKKKMIFLKGSALASRFLTATRSSL